MHITFSYNLNMDNALYMRLLDHNLHHALHNQ